MERETILIFGVSSFVGSNLASFLKDHFRVVGTYYNHKTEIPGMLTFRCDVLNRDEVQLAIYTFKPNYTIYAAGLTNRDFCHRHYKLADALNTAGVFNVTEYSERYKSKMIYISSAYVYNGDKREFVESDTPDSNTIYGKTVAASEFYIQKTCLNYIIFRCCHLYGRNSNPRARSLFEGIERGLFNDETLNLDANIHEGFLDINYLGMIIKLCIQRDTSNRLFQISSKDIATRFDFGKMYCEVFQQLESHIQRANWPFPLVEGHIAGSSLYYWQDTNNIESYLSIELPTIKESLEYSFRRWGGQSGKSKKSESLSEIKYI